MVQYARGQKCALGRHHFAQTKGGLEWFAGRRVPLNRQIKIINGARRSNRLEQIKKERVCLRGRGVSRKNTMNKWSADKSVCLLLVTIILGSSRLLFGGPEPLATDGKDYSKEVVPAPAPPKEWDIRIGVPGWLMGVSGDAGILGVVGSVDVPFHELLDHLTHVPLVLSIDTRYKRWEFFGDGQVLCVGCLCDSARVTFYQCECSS